MSKPFKIILSIFIFLAICSAIPFVAWLLFNYYEIIGAILDYALYVIVGLIILTFSTYAIIGIYKWLDKIDKK